MLRMAAVALASLLLASCAQREEMPSDLTIAVAARPRTLDVRFATDATSFRIGQLLYRAPVRFDDRSLPVPWLCDWQRINDQHFRFTIRHPTRFSDDAMLVAADVKATYESILDPATASPHRGSLKHIERIVVVDDRTLDFHLARSDVLFPASLVVGVMPARWLQSPQGRAPSSGSFVLLHSRDDLADIWLQRRHDKSIVRFRETRDPTVRVLQLLKGEVDVLQNNLPPELITWLEEKNTLTVKRHRGSTFAYVGFNIQDAITSDRRVRQAIAHAIDRKAITRHLFAGAARLANSILPPEHWAGNAELKGWNYDPDRSLELLRSMGYSNHRRLKITYKTSKSPLRLRLATTIQQQLSAVGIDLSIESYDWGTFYGDVKAGNFQMYSLAWVGIKKPDIYRYAFHTESLPPAGANRGRYVNAEVDRLIERAERARTITDKQHYYALLQQHILSGLPYIPLWYEDNVVITGAKGADYRLAGDGNFLALETIKLAQKQ